jgi:hypothetical protein
MNKAELVTGGNEWQISNLKFCRWTKKLSEELNKTGFGYIDTIHRNTV